MLVLLMAIELMFLGLGLGFVGHGTVSVDPSGQVYALFLLAVSAAESAVGLGLIIAAFKTRGHINVSDFSGLKC
jgi:NADH-quinone oxidoreductase subunit K